MATRAEHLAWCKRRAHKALNYGGPDDAVASMLSDLGKHPETLDSIGVAAVVMMTVRDRASAIAFINGFN